MKMVWQLDMDTPLGPVRLRADGEGFLRSLRFITPGEDIPANSRPGREGAAVRVNEEDVTETGAEKAGKTLHLAAEQLESFFAGKRTTFDLPLRDEKSPFRRQVYRALLEIPPGETISYGELARKTGKPGAARAVGGALAENDILIIIPCHRVVPSSGGCGAYRDGARLKSALIALEKQLVTFS